MRAIKRVDTKPEVSLRKALHRLGYRYRKDLRIDLGFVKVRPDIVFTSRRIAVFVDGCFWHSCPTHGRHPTINQSYWIPKLNRTVERDLAANAALESAGWRVIRLWEHESLQVAIDTVVEAIDAVIEHASDASGQN